MQLVDRLRVATPLVEQLLLVVTAQLVLGQADGIAQRVGAAISRAEDVLDEGTVHVHVGTSVDGTCGSKESDGTSLRVEHGCLTDIALVRVEGHDVA